MKHANAESYELFSFRTLTRAKPTRPNQVLAVYAVLVHSSIVPPKSFHGWPLFPFIPSQAFPNALPRLVNVESGTLLQKLKVETEVRALSFDDTGLFLLAGTKKGSELRSQTM